jgi:prepilin-type N-terminal cleavage/methylation domain-containing protein
VTRAKASASATTSPIAPWHPKIQSIKSIQVDTGTSFDCLLPIWCSTINRSFNFTSPSKEFFMSRRKGFTLPEMLTVMAIMLIIITMLMPIFARAREQARYVKWSAYSARLRSDIDLILYYNFENQTPSDLILRNRAVGDPHKVTAKYAVDPARRDGQLDSGGSIPKWTRGRWYGKGGMDFNGAGDVVKMGTAKRLPEGKSNRSIYGWGRPDVLSNNRWLIGYGGTGQGMRVGLTSGNKGSGADLVEAGTVWDDFEWHMIALTYNGTNAKLYVDGKEVSSQGKDWDITSATGFVGAGPGGGNLWDGVIDEVAIFGSVLTAQQIAEIFKVGSAKSRN